MSKQSRTDLARVDAVTDDEALRLAQEDPDAAPTDAAFWADVPLSVPRPKKVPVHIRLSPEVVDWFKSHGPGYQSRINEVLETYVEHQKQQGERTGAST
ncbi:MAG: BrnA antitoxin family protein [Desulfovibrionaceae bacterium]|jgi:uncharacterized protein (DUF4415 family)|nr:BrnA antitoxin family protein [Desulfovibrionaceae bacterium]